MYITRFVRKDRGPNEDYAYHSLKQAQEHLYKFMDDDSNLYRNISIYEDDKNKVDELISFDEQGRMRLHIAEGTPVKIAKSWQNPGEDKYVFIVRNINEETENIVIECQNSLLTLKPTENVFTYMIDNI